MRLSDIGDWFALRRVLREPWAFLRLRTRDAAPYDVRFRDGAVVHLRPVPMDRHTFHRIFARDAYRLNREPPGAFGTVIDVGAHIGLFAARVAPLARRVLSFEPVAANFAVLKRNVAAWPHVVPVSRAVAERRGTSTIFVSDNPSAHSMFPSTEERRAGGTSVECVTLADVFTEHAIDRCDLLKLDCEGAEYEILYGVPRALWPRIGRICLEYHPVACGPPEWTGESLELFLESVGHRVERIPSRKDPAKGRLFSRLK